MTIFAVATIMSLLSCGLVICNMFFDRRVIDSNEQLHQDIYENTLIKLAILKELKKNGIQSGHSDKTEED